MGVRDEVGERARVKWTLYPDLAVRWLEASDPAPYWDLETGRPFGLLRRPVESPGEVLLVAKTLFEPREDRSWESASGRVLPAVPEGYELFRLGPDGAHALLTGPLEGVDIGTEMPPQVTVLLEKMGYRGLWLFHFDENGWTRLSGTPFPQSDEAPAARWVPDHRAVQIEGAWAYRFRPEHCRLWFPSTGRTFSTGPSGSKPIAEELWAFGDERGHLCVCGPTSESRKIGEGNLDELRQLAHCPGYFFTGGEQACIWDLELKVRARLKTGLVWDLCAAGDRLLVRTQTGASLWSVPQGKRLLDKPITDPDDTRFEPCIFSSHAGDWFLLARFSMMSREVWCWAIHGQTLEQRSLTLPTGVCRGAARLLPDGKLLFLTDDGRWHLHAGPKWELCARLETRPSGGWVVSTPGGKYDAADGETAGGKHHVPGLWQSLWCSSPSPTRKRRWGIF
ncbi:MAG: hypothetical protein AMXMBFR33_33530 [Candidatus Xenobia bacterium]